MKKSLDLLKAVFYCAVFVFAFSSCETEDPIPAPKPVIPGAYGVFILNEGNDKGNDAGISYYNFETETFTLDIREGKLGDLAQDMMAYGSKLYISMSGSSNITVLDIKTHELLKQIEVKDKDKPRQPRYLTAYKENIYASTYDGNVIRIDTATLTLQAVTKVGKNPEGIAVVNGKLYVANSGGLNYASQMPPDSTLSVVDIATFKEEKTIKVGVNPFIVKAGNDDNVYITYIGDYGDIPGGIQKLDTRTGTVTNLNISASRKFVLLDDLLYFYNVTYDENWVSTGSFGVYNIATGLQTSGFISDGTEIPSPYTIGVNPRTKEVYVANSAFPNKSKVYVFGTDGKKKADFETGIGSNTFVFY
jgi:hypothetical protein